ncbi:MAG TPA: hypothetical protein VFL98_01670 [Candidatus Paceibacterota bacterium]|nr:hypothetical protein [Candidatus Paceibacterota bacterium]
MNIHSGRVLPLVDQMIGTRSLPVRIAIFGSRHDNWSLKNLQRPEDAETYPEFVARIRAAISGIGGGRIFAPNPVAPSTGAICQQEDLIRHIDLGGRMEMHRNQDLHADGSFLRQMGDTGIFSAGGCGMLIAIRGTSVVFAHVSRESVFDRIAVMSRGERQDESRPYFGVAEAAIAALDAKEHPDEVFAWPLFGLPPDSFEHSFEHSQYGAFNIALGEYLEAHHSRTAAPITDDAVYPDLSQLVRERLELAGVPHGQICMDHAYVPETVPTTRNGGGSARYLVAAVREG